MTDFVVYEPHAQSPGPVVDIEIRSATLSDIEALAGVMAARGGSVEDHVDLARRLIEQLDVLLVAVRGRVIVGWCGIQRSSIHAGHAPEWLIAGLTVVPGARRQGIGARLLGEVLSATSQAAPAEPSFSVINAGNLASIDLHEQLGFIEIVRAASFAGIEFTGGEGVLLRRL